MTVLTRSLLVLGFVLGSSASVWAYDMLSGLWTLKVENRSHHVVATLTVKFTTQAGRSCMFGDWLRVNVVSATTEDLNFYPVSDPLSFHIENNRLTIGRNEVCDAYLMLSGPANDKVVKGEYYALGLGGTSPRGFFTLSRTK